MPAKIIWFTAAACILLCTTNGSSAPLCSAPKPGLSGSDPRVEGHPLSFNVAGRRYLIDIYSKFESTPDKSYCILYETDNKTDIVAKFFWETAGFDEPRLSVGRHSLFRKIPPGRPPIVHETTLYAFTSTKMDSFAFSRTAQKASNAASTTERAMRRPDASEADDGNGSRIRLSDALQSGDIGIEFRSPSFDLTARSYIKGAHDKFLIAFRVDAGKGVKGVQAPYASLLLQNMPRSPAPAAGAMASFNQIEKVNLHLTNNSYFAGAPFVGKESDWVYVVEHPIIVEHDGGATCLIAHAYSTAPVNPGYGCRSFGR